MFAIRAAIGPSTIGPATTRRGEISTTPERPRIVAAIAASIGKFLDQLVTGSTQNLSGPNRTLSLEYFRFPPF